MTDLPSAPDTIPSRLGISLDVDADGTLFGTLAPEPAVCERGVVPVAVLVLLVDMVGGVGIDTDPDRWAFTSDLTLRAPAAPPPDAVVCTTRLLRDGRRSTVAEAPMHVDGRPWAHSYIGFSRIERRPEDPEKGQAPIGRIGRMRQLPPIQEPIRTAAGFRSVDPANGSMAVELEPRLLNPAGAMQGALVAALAEAAAEDLADHHRMLGDRPHVVVEVEIRFLAQNRTSPIVTRARPAGSPGQGLVLVELVDDGGRGRITTSVLCRMAPAPS